ncbi:MAG: hypothetical protein PHS14_04940 [Elusimicrobia bacterium]|nr:hypothetical protein [Elusimicrobiota bacterium]
MTEPWAETQGIYPTRNEMSVAAEWRKAPPEKLEHLVASIPVQTLLRFLRAAEDLAEFRAALSRRRELLAAEWHDAADVGELNEIQAWLKKKSAELAQPEAIS